MKSTEYLPRSVKAPAPAPIAAESELEALREAFYSRLRSDRARMLTLCAELARAETYATPVYSDIRMVAHRLGGAAAMFDAPQISQAAVALEDAAVTAINTHADNVDSTVWTALEALVDLLAATHGSRLSGGQSPF